MRQSRCNRSPQSFYLSALTLAIYMGGAATLALASTPVIAAAAQNYNITAGSLDAVLNRFAAQSQVDVYIDGRLTQGKSSTGLKGQYRVEQGFAQILHNTGLSVEKTAKGYQLIEKKTAQPAPIVTSSDTAVSQLPALVVSATDSLSDQAKNNYAVSRSSSATKLDLSLKDTPQSITIITQKQIEEQGLTDVNKILEATPGVTVSNFGVPGAGRAKFYSRGYEINNVMVDGAPTLISGKRGMELLAGYDTIIYDRVEVTRGSTGLSTGTGDPSASINFVRKRPGINPARNAKLSWGTWGKKRAELDISQPFTEDGSIRGRFVAAYAQGNSYIDRIQEESKIFYGIVEADISDKTTVALGGTWSDKDADDASPHMTSVTGGNSYSRGEFNAGRKWNAATDWSYSHIRMWNSFLTLDHKFNDDWKLSTNYQFSKSSPDRKWGLVGSEWYDVTNNTASYAVGRENYQSKVQNLDITLTGKFELFGRDAQVALGINGFESDTYDPLHYTIFVSNSPSCGRRANCVDLDNWNNGHLPYPENNQNNSIRRYGQYPLDYKTASFKINEKQYGYFFSTKFEPIDRLKVILGTRFNHYQINQDYYNVKNIKNASSTYEYSPKDKWIPYAGLVYDLNPNTSVYASYTGIYKTQLKKDLHDEFLPFIEGDSYEIGLKSLVFGERLNLNTALFTMQEKNLGYQMLEVPINPATGRQYKCELDSSEVCYIMYASDGPRVSGFEVSAQGEITPNWLINAGYTYLHVGTQNGYERVSGSSMTEGTYSYERPRHAINLSTSYLLTDKLTLGGALRWKSKTTQGINYCTETGFCSDTINNEVQKPRSQGSFSVVDLMARYLINQNMVLGLNISNLFDKEYKSNYLGSVYGTPRSATVSLNLKF